MQRVKIETEYITLDQLLKYAGIVPSGGQAKRLIAEGDIWVNGEETTVVRRKLYPGDRVDVPDVGGLMIIEKNED